jgi:hypothetical protein
VSGRPEPAAGDLAAGLASVEGFLLAAHERAAARAEAERFADRLPWLLSAQRDDVVHHYADFRLTSARRQCEAVAARCAELRAEYEERYARLRLRLVRTCTAAVLTAVPAAVGLACLVSRLA